MPPKTKTKSSERKSKSANERKTVVDDVKITTSQSSTFVDSEEAILTRCIRLDLELEGDPPINEEYMLLVLFNGVIILESKWDSGFTFNKNTLPINLNDVRFQTLIASNPLLFLLRVLVGKPNKLEADPLLNTENRAGGTVDLLPLLLGEEDIFTNVRLVSLNTGKFIGCNIIVHVVAPGLTEHTHIPLTLTMVSAHCMPLARDGTVYVSAIGLSDIHTPMGITFGQSLSTKNAQRIVWATVSNAGQGANTANSVIDDDLFVLEDFDPKDSQLCRSFYWNAMNRVLIDPKELKTRLSSPFLIEVAGVPKTGKIDIRGRYMGWVDARALLEPGQLDVTVCTKLLHYSEIQTPHVSGLLDLPPSSAKTTSARDTDIVLDEYRHNAYISIRFNLTEALNPKAKLFSFYDTIGYPQTDSYVTPVYRLDIDAVSEEPIIDVRHIRKEAGALAVHEELSSLASQGGIAMNQGIKRSAANHLLMRVRTMLKNFSPGECSYIDWQDTVTAHHAASRRAVTASFAPQPPRPRVPDRVTVSRCKVAVDNRLAERYVKINLKVAGSHPRSLLCKVIRCLEERNDLDAKNYLLEALNGQPRNKYLLWILGAQEFDQGVNGIEIADAAFRIAVKGDSSDGTTNAIAWAAVHALHHTNGNVYSAHVAARKMRKSYSLPKEWIKVLKRWSDISGEEEILWSPSTITTDNPILIAAAFFLCLRCYKFCETLLQCVEKKCATHGSSRVKYESSVDVNYLRAASFVLRCQTDLAMDCTLKGIQKYGPSSLMSQMKLICVANTRNWDTECEKALKEAENAGSMPCPSVIYKAALSTYKSNPKLSLQRAALVHKMASSGHTALLMGRIYARLKEYDLSTRWCSCAVKIEPLLSDGWAMLSILAMYERNVNKARAMLRTARQVGTLAPDIESELKSVMEIVAVEELPDFLVKNLCLKTNYD